MSLLSGIVDVFKSVVEIVTDIVSAIWDAIIDIISSIISFIVKLIKAVIDFIIDNIWVLLLVALAVFVFFPGAFTAVSTFIGKVGSMIYSGMSTLIGWIKYGAAELYGWFANYGVQAAKIAWTGLTYLASGIKEVAGFAFSFLDKYGREILLGGAVLAGGNGVLDFFQDNWLWIVGAALGFYLLFYARNENSEEVEEQPQAINIYNETEDDIKTTDGKEGNWYEE